MLSPNDFKSEIEIHSPGRINLIGEHIDYNGGHVLPAAIDKKIKFKLRKNHSSKCEVFSSNFNQVLKINLNDLRKSEVEWHNFVIGVLHYINVLKPGSIGGFDCIVESNLPLGSGISSSAALECGIAKGMNELFNIGLSDLEIIKLSRDAEHNFVGTKCGIMDQFAVVKGKKNHLILLNCKTMKYELIEVNFEPYTIVLLNSNVSHSLASSEYNIRRNECNIALTAMKKKYPRYEFLTEVPVKVVKEFSNVLPETIYNRALYVTQENKRTLKAVSLLKKRKLSGFGECMYKSHSGLQHLYEVSCNELDFLVDQTRELNYVIGSRMMGGGFGGCTINLVHKDKVEEFIEQVSKSYKEEYNIQLSPIIINISNGVEIL